MQFGVIPAHGPECLHETIEQVKLCEKLGVDSIWIEEHHARGPYWPTPLLALASLAPFTDHVRLGTDILVLPLHDPVHVAEQVAILDVMTRGRMILAVALGDNDSEFAMFRVRAARRGMAFEEQIRIIRALWTGKSVTFSGEAYHYENIRLPVIPVQNNAVPIWIGGWGPRQLERAARLGDAWMPGPVGDLPGVIERQSKYLQHVKARGEDPLNRARPLTRDLLVAETEEEAWQLAEKDLLPAYDRDYFESDHPLVGTQSGVRFANLHELARDRLIIGNPEGVTREAIRCIKLTQADHLIFRLKLPGISPDTITRMIQLLGTEVIPAIKAEFASA